MKIELLVSRATATTAQNRGDTIEVPDDEAIRMIDAGQAVAVRGKSPEKAVEPLVLERAKK